MVLVIVSISIFIIIVVACLAYSFIFGASENYGDDEFEEYDAGYNNRHNKSDSQESDNK